MNTWCISDLHFFHRRIREYCPISRGHLNSVEEMNEELINNWNSKISNDDLVYVLGDVSFGKELETVEILQRLFGSKILIEGNHDHKMLKSQLFRNEFKEIHKRLMIRHNGMDIVMDHFPIMEWENRHNGSIHLHGHTHSQEPNIWFRRMEIGVDSNHLRPYNLNDIVEFMKNQPIGDIHQKGN